MSFSCLGPSGSPSLRPYWPPSFGRLNSVTPRDNGSTTDLAQTPTTSCSSSGWCSLWDSTGSWAYMSGRSYTRTGIQDPRSNQQQKQNPTLPSLSYSPDSFLEWFTEPKLSTTRPDLKAGWYSAGLKVGVHVSISGSIDQAVDRAKEEGCDTFQVFTRNPRGWKFADLDPDEVKRFKEKLAQSNLGPVVDHMPYLPNLSCPEVELYEKSTATLLAEVDRCGTLGIPYLVCHLGSHLGMGRDVGLQRITDALNMAVKRVKKDPWILLENMAGQRNSMGSNFPDIR